LARLWGSGAKWQGDSAAHVHEAHLLRLDSAKACARLGWAPRWSLDETLAHTVEWYKGYYGGEDVRGRSLKQIEDYVQPMKVDSAKVESASVESANVESAPDVRA
jgi:CDP-glucose 4,6-dehydratase